MGALLRHGTESQKRRYLPEIGPSRVCLLSGRAVEQGYAGEVGVDVALPLSDHAGFSDLLQYAVRSGASRVLTVHGYAEDLAHALRQRGVRAHSIRELQRQLELF